MKHTELNRAEHIFNPWLDSRSIRRQNATRGYSKHSLSLSNSAPSLLRVPQINRPILASDKQLAKFIAVRKEKKEMSIYESLRRGGSEGMNDFGLGESFKSYPRMPVLNAYQPAQIVGLTPPDKRPSVETLNLMPPFERFFIECALPPELQFNAVNFANDVNNKGRVLTFDERVTEIGLDVSIHRDAKYVHTPEELRPKTHLICKPFYLVGNVPAAGIDPLCVSNFQIYIALGADGFPVPVPGATPASMDEIFRENSTAFWVGQDGEAYSVTVRHRTSPEAWQEALGEGLNLARAYEKTVSQFADFLPLLYAINSLHNKRTVLSTVQPSRQVRRAAQRGGQTPPDQKTIVVKDFVTIMQGARKSQAQGNSHPLGETIGHWRRYGVDGRQGLLFGKYRGTFFVPSFLRGNPDKGATDHDYVLKVGTAA